MNVLERACEQLNHAEASTKHAFVSAHTVINELKGMIISLEAERKKLQEEVVKLQKERQDLEAEKQLAAELNAQADDIIHLNVGGQKVSISRSRLCMYPQSMLSAWFSGRHLLKRDADGCILLDRTPQWFEYVLDFLRNDGNLTKLPADESERERVLQEFDYFCLPSPLDETRSLAEVYASGVCRDAALGLDSGTGQKGKKDVPTQELPAMFCVDVSDEIVVAGGRDGKVYVWDVGTTRLVGALEGHTGVVTHVAIMGGVWRGWGGGGGGGEGEEEETVVVSAASDKTIKLWDVSTGTCLTTLRLTCQPLKLSVGLEMVAVTFHTLEDEWDEWDAQGTYWLKVWNRDGEPITGLPNVRVLARRLTDAGGRVIAAMDRDVCLYDASGVTPWPLHAKFSGHTSDIDSLALSNEGRTIVSCSGPLNLSSAECEREVMVWNAFTGQRLWRTHLPLLVPSLAITEMSLVCVTLPNGTVRIVDIGGGRSVEIQENVGNKTTAIAACGNVVVFAANTSPSVRMFRPRRKSWSG